MNKILLGGRFAHMWNLIIKWVPIVTLSRRVRQGTPYMNKIHLGGRFAHMWNLNITWVPIVSRRCRLLP